MDGVILPLRLTHQNLARLVGARRPSVTTALRDLARSGHVIRRHDGSWLLHGGPPAELHDIRPPQERMPAAPAFDGLAAGRTC